MVNQFTTKETRIYNMEKIVSSVNGTGKQNSYKQNNETRPLFLITQTETDKRLNSKS